MATFMKHSALAALALCSSSALAATSDQWRGKSIYQVLTDRFARTDGSTTATCDAGQGRYCGGSFKGIQNHLDYIQDMGFDAIWISPVTGQIQSVTPYGDPYHGYWQQDIFSINSHFGTEQDLKDLAGELHNRGMYLMIDVVVNHFAYNGAPSNVDYSMFNPFNSASDFHTYCPIDYNDISDTQQLEHCWVGDTTVALPDVKTEDSGIAGQWNSWIANMVSTYGIDGLRIDTAIEVDTGFWSGFGNAADVYFVGETYNGEVDFVCDFQNYMPGVMDYPGYYPVLDAFTNTPASDDSLMGKIAARINDVKNSCKDTTIKGTFTENHDIRRFAQINGDMSAAKNVIAYTLLADGIPIIYEGQEQHYASLGGSGDPYNREAIWFSGYNKDAELYKLVATLNSVRKAAIAAEGNGYLIYKNYPVYSDTTTVAMRKGNMITVLSNKGANGDAYQQVIPSGLAAGTQVTEVLTCQRVTVDGNGGIQVPMQGGLPRVYYPSANLGGVC